jgi:hypothetical protein
MITTMNGCCIRAMLRSLVFIWLGLLAAPACLAQQIALNPLKKTGVYSTGEQVSWQVEVLGQNAGSVTQANYTLKRNGLTIYYTQGNTNRDKSYFPRMYLSCYRAAEYLTQRPDWDGRTLVVMGTSMGGQQAIVTAALYPKVTFRGMAGRAREGKVIAPKIDIAVERHQPAP